MGDESCQEGQGVRVNRKTATPHFTRWMFLCDEPIGMIQRHQDDYETAQGIQWDKPRACFPREWCIGDGYPPAQT